MEQVGLLNGRPGDFSLLPEGTAWLRFEFTLKKPYISRDDAAFHILDNPVRKDKVFKIPMMSASSWKGNLRWMAGFQTIADWQPRPDLEAGPREARRRELITSWPQRRLRLLRLFGPEQKAAADYFNKNLAILLNPGLSQELIDKNEKEISGAEAEAVTAINNAFTDYLVRQGLPAGEDQGFRGRLHFFPTFFDAVDLEVINPHDRETGAGKLPIYFESVPAGARGNFSLLYVPWDLMGCGDQEGLAAGVKADLCLVANAMVDLMLNYGFSAKKSSGFGVIEEELSEGALTFKGSKEPGTLEKYEFSNLAALSTHLKNLGEDHDAG